MNHPPHYRTPPTHRFDVVSVGEGWAAADSETGRELSTASDWTTARSVATTLNAALADGHKSLARALKAVD